MKATADSVHSFLKLKLVVNGGDNLDAVFSIVPELHGTRQKLIPAPLPPCDTAGMRKISPPSSEIPAVITDPG
ncbi:MAG: hypothetical protein ABL907_02720, partial [Hyphomicrobium sp.]